MTKIILSGCMGRMGKAISAIVAETEDAEIVCGFDLAGGDCGYPVYSDYASVSVDADVIIDFSHPANLNKLLSFAKRNDLPIVVATTGLTEDQKKELSDASKIIPVFFSANMSLGINLLIRLAKQAAKILEGSFDIEIIEKHHNKKIDAPSGTALAIADGIAESLSNKPEYVYERHSVRKPREKQEIGLHAVRGGTIVGEHEVLFAGPDEVISLSHSAQSRDVFAQGAVRAAKFLSKKSVGFYSMDDLFSDLV